MSNMDGLENDLGNDNYKFRRPIPSAWTDVAYYTSWQTMITNQWMISRLGAPLADLIIRFLRYRNMLLWCDTLVK